MKINSQQGKRFLVGILLFLGLVACGEEAQREVFLHHPRFPGDGKTDSIAEHSFRYRLFVLLAGIEIALGREDEATQLLPWDVGNEYAMKLAKQGDNAKALIYFSGAFKKAEEFGPNDPRLLISLNNLTGIYQKQGNFHEMKHMLKRAVVLTSHDPESLDHASSLNNLAGFYQSQGRLAEAEPLFTQALDFREKKLGDFHPDVIMVRNNLASLYIAQGRYPEAEPLLRNSIDVVKKNSGPVPLMIALLENYASLLQALKQNEEAEKIIRQFTRLKNGTSIKDMERLG